VKIHGSGTNGNNCDSLVPELGLENTAVVTVTIATDAFPQPHQGDPIELTNTKLTIKIPADLLQQGVDGGIIDPNNPPTITSNITLVLAGSSTTQGQHTYKLNDQKSKPKFDSGGNALPLTATVTLPNTTWTPKNDTDPVIFTEKSLKISSAIPVLGGIHANFTCEPDGALQVVGLAAQGSELPVTTTTTPTGTEGGTTTTTTMSVTTPVSGSGTLPRTGGNALLLLVFAAMLIDVGIAMTGAARRRMHHFG
jgi:hypothetical protein